MLLVSRDLKPLQKDLVATSSKVKQYRNQNSASFQVKGFIILLELQSKGLKKGLNNPPFPELS